MQSSNPLPQSTQSWQIATWNLNSLRMRLPHLGQWLAQNPVAILALQETKLRDELFPSAELATLGYHGVYLGEKSYNGVAILLQQHLAGEVSEIETRLPIDCEQKRFMALTVAGVRVVCVYVPNGQSPQSDKFIYKQAWLAALHDWVASELVRYPKLILMGDFNIAPADEDVWDPILWQDCNLVSPQERQAFQRLLDLGLVDVFRRFEQPSQSYSWWDYRQGSFRRNAGLRIDHILLSPALTVECKSCVIDRTPRAWLQPSDHAPVIATLNRPTGVVG